MMVNIRGRVQPEVPYGYKEFLVCPVRMLRMRMTAD